MPDQNRSTEPDKNDKRSGEMRLPPRTFLVWVAIIIIAVVVAFVRNGNETPPDELASFPDLVDKLTNGLIVPNSGHIVYGLQSPDIKRVIGKYYSKQANGEFVKDHEEDGNVVQAGDTSDGCHAHGVALFPRVQSGP
jgi:hypothetical protein